MALTVTPIMKPTTVGDRFKAIAKVAADTSYPTGGYALSMTQIGLGKSADQDPELELEFDNSLGYVPHYDYVGNKLKFYSAAGTEVANTTNLSTINDLRIKATSKYRG